MQPATSVQPTHAASGSICNHHGKSYATCLQQAVFYVCADETPAAPGGLRNQYCGPRADVQPTWSPCQPVGLCNTCDDCHLLMQPLQPVAAPRKRGRKSIP